MTLKTKICIGLLTHCRDEDSKRFEILKKSVDTLSIVKKQRDDIRKLPRDALFKGIGKELLDKLAAKYKKKGTNS